MPDHKNKTSKFGGRICLSRYGDLCQTNWLNELADMQKWDRPTVKSQCSAQSAVNLIGPVHEMLAAFAN